MHSMARQKATITLDRRKADVARSLAGTATVSEAIDIALDEFIRRQQLRNDIAAYQRQPPAADEKKLGELPMQLDLGDEDVDYDAFYGAEP
jgi:hypothetical protein